MKPRVPTHSLSLSLSRSRANNQCCLVHCKMGISRSASTVENFHRSWSFQCFLSFVSLGISLSYEGKQPFIRRCVGSCEETTIMHQSQRRISNSITDLWRHPDSKVSEKPSNKIDQREYSLLVKNFEANSQTVKQRRPRRLPPLPSGEKQSRYHPSAVCR